MDDEKLKPKQEAYFIRSEEEMLRAMRAVRERLSRGENQVASTFAVGDYAQCDFCGARPPVWDYPCRDFVQYVEFGVTDDGTTPTVHQQWSKGEWSACEKCHTDIEAGNKEGPLHRAFINICHSDPKYMKEITYAHEQFYRNRTGPPVKCP